MKNRLEKVMDTREPLVYVYDYNGTLVYRRPGNIPE